VTNTRVGDAPRPALLCGSWDHDDILLRTRVQPRSSRALLGAVENERLKIRLTAPPADGKANEQARKLLAKAFGIGITGVQLVRGQTSRDKLFRITAPGTWPAAIVEN
jgi:uncharacterized protein (TIGR00251 family)